MRVCGVEWSGVGWSGVGVGWVGLGKVVVDTKCYTKWTVMVYSAHGRWRSESRDVQCGMTHVYSVRGIAQRLS